MVTRKGLALPMEGKASGSMNSNWVPFNIRGLGPATWGALEIMGRPCPGALTGRWIILEKYEDFDPELLL